jgi:hypothetical protein
MYECAFEIYYELLEILYGLDPIIPTDNMIHSGMEPWEGREDK